VAILITQKGTKHFSTYHELVQLAAHLELIIKNNIPHILELNRDEYPTYLRQSLNPVSPVIGASGETSGRSSQARKFRMPGYPLALVSTDVFQEGEDLHTFCDSVVHYGLSGTPVSFEQKTGRVDRVSSMAFCPDGTRLVSGGHDGSVRLWDAATGSQVAVLHGHSDRVFSVAFSRSGERIASGTQQGEIRIWTAPAESAR